MDFFQTKMGYKFFTADFPRLIKALERIADLLEKQSELEKFIEEDLKSKVTLKSPRPIV